MESILKKNTYSLLAIDLDGTLVNSDKVITPRTLKALEEVQQKGVQIVISTGRPVEGAMHIAEQLELTQRGGFLVSYNGALVHDCLTREEIFSCPVPDRYIPFLLQRALENDCAFVVYQGDVVLTTDASSEYVQYSGRNNHLPVREARDFLAEANSPFYKGLIVGEPSQMPSLRDRLTEEMHGELDFCLSEPFFLECVAPGVSKMGGIEAVLRRTETPIEQVIAMGDSDNDVSMIQRAGLGVAMGNAREKAKLAADVVTASNEEDGVADIIEKYLL
jgi:Cof subfamily protein (haloacid dehalogenase superfamily)